ncbi:MAG: hypothetical protein JWR21_4376 [Herminiimonas sp.]|nr:hypothetical protein [Herminiimonas sp.]
MDNIESVAAFYAREEEKISSTQSAIEELSGHFGSPVYFGCFIAFVFCWTVANLSAERFGWHQFDAPPFFWLQGIVAINGVLITIAVLIRQNRIARVAELRAHLSLHITLLSEQKTSKVIHLLEELRRDSPGVKNRHDPEAETMKKQTDPHAMLSALDSQKDDKGVG